MFRTTSRFILIKLIHDHLIDQLDNSWTIEIPIKMIYFGFLDKTLQLLIIFGQYLDIHWLFWTISYIYFDYFGQYLDIFRLFWTISRYIWLFWTILLIFLDYFGKYLDIDRFGQYLDYFGQHLIFFDYFGQYLDIFG